MSQPLHGAGAIAAPREFTLFDVLLLVKRHSRRLVVTTLACALLAFGGTYLISPKFVGETRFLPPNQQQSGLAGLLSGSLGGLSDMAGGLGVLKGNGDEWLGIVKSRTIEDALIQRFNLLKRYDEEYMFRARRKLESRTDVTLGKDGIITIDVEDTDPKTAAQMADAYVDELQKLNNTMAVTDAAQRRVFFERQLKAANEMLIQAETALRAGGINESLLKASPDAAADIVGELKGQEMATQIRLEVLRTRVTENSPEYRQLQRELESLRSQIATANSKQAAGKDADGSGNGYIRRYRDFKYAETLFEIMARQTEMARADEARQGSLIQVIDRAAVPEWKSSPKRVVITLIAAFLAFAFLVTRLLVREALLEARTARPSLDATLEALRATRWFR